MGVKNITRYKIIVSILFGLLGFVVNFYSINFPFPPYTATVLIGLLFPMLITLTWGWRYGLLSALAGGCQSMWWIWGPSNGYAVFTVVPPFTLWILWHGYFAGMRRKSDDRKWWQNMYVVEIPFRILTTINLFTLARWGVSLNPPPWDWASEAPNMIPMEFSTFVVIKQFVVGYIILLLADVLLNIEFTRKFFGLKKRLKHTRTGYIISVSLLIGVVFWVLDSVISSVIFYPESSFIDMIALNIPPGVFYVRTFFILACLAGGLMFSKLLQKHFEIEGKFKYLYSMVRLMCDNLPDLIWTKDLKSKFIFVNKACCEILLNAKDTDEPIGKDDIYFAKREMKSHPGKPDYHTFGEKCIESDSIVMETEKPIRGDEFGYLKGEKIYLDVYKAPFFDDNDDMIGTVGYARIITKEKELEEARIKAEKNVEHLNNILKAIRNVNQLIVVETDRDKLVQQACDTMIEGRSYEAVWLGLLENGESFFTVKGSGFREDVNTFCKYVMDGNHPPCIKEMLAGNNMLNIVDKSQKCGDCPFKDACSSREVVIVRIEHAGKLFGLLAVSIISDDGVDKEEEGLLKEVSGDLGLALYKIEIDKAHKKVEKELQESEERLSQIVSTNPMPSFVMDIDHIVTHWNKACENLTGVSADEVVGTNKVWPYFYPEERPVMSDLIIDEALEQDIASYYTGMYEKSTVIDGAYEAEGFFPDMGERGKWLLLTASPLKDRHGKVIGAIEIFQDITGRKQDEERLSNINTELEERVAERTVELQDKNTELEEMNRIFMGREVRMAELKEQIAELEMETERLKKDKV